MFFIQDNGFEEQKLIRHTKPMFFPSKVTSIIFPFGNSTLNGFIWTLCPDSCAGISTCKAVFLYSKAVRKNYIPEESTVKILKTYLFSAQCLEKKTIHF